MYNDHISLLDDMDIYCNADTIVLSFFYHKFSSVEKEF